MRKYWAMFLLGICMVLMCACSVADSKVGEPVPENEIGSEADSINDTFDYGTEDVSVTVEKATIESTGEDSYRIQMIYKIQNDSEKDFGYNTFAWQAFTPDGWGMPVQNAYPDTELQMVPADASLEAEVIFHLSSSERIDEFIAEYTFLNYDEDYWEAFNDFKYGRIEFDVFIDKYGDAEILEFTVKIEE